MIILKANEVEKSLCKKGFVKTDKRHRKYIFYVGGKKTAIWTMTSHNSQDVGVTLQSCMARQLRLTKEDFIRLISCSLKQDEYVQMLRDGGYL